MAQGAWCDRVYAITSICTPSRASFLTGKRPDKHRLRWNSEYPIPYNRQEFRDDEQFFVANMACDQLAQLKDTEQSFSMVVSMWGPHHPYYPNEVYADLIDPADITPYPTFDEDLSDKPWRYRVQHDLRCQHRAFERWPDWDTWQTVMARCYSAGLQTDAAIGRIADQLDHLGLSDNTLFVVTADHGDGIAAHGAGWDSTATTCSRAASLKSTSARFWPTRPSPSSTRPPR